MLTIRCNHRSLSTDRRSLTVLFDELIQLHIRLGMPIDKPNIEYIRPENEAAVAHGDFDTVLAEHGSYWPGLMALLPAMITEFPS